MYQMKFGYREGFMGYTVYMHVFPNNKKYIGITSQKPKYRWGNGNRYKGQKQMWNAIQKYGWDNIEHIILYSNVSKEDAETIEKRLIKQWNTANHKYGYNIDLGGNAIDKISIATRMKMSKAHKGKKLTEEAKQKVSKAFSKPVMCVDTNVIYKSASEAYRQTKICQNHICECCNNKRKTAGKYKWKYIQNT